MTTDAIDLIELRARSDARWLLTRDNDLAAVGTDTDERWVAPNHVELADKLHLGVLA